MTLFSSKAFGGGDPLEVVERRRRSPLGLSAAVGAVPDAPAPYSPSKPLRDALRPAEAPETGSPPETASETGAANRPDDLFRARRALKQAGEPAPADPGPAGLADGLKRFQARRGLTADGFARPGGPTDRALDNIRRRRRRLAAQGRPETGETLDDRLAIFAEAERDRRAAAADDFAALMQSRTGRLHVLRLAGTALESVARPLVERDLHRLRAERTPLTREDDPPEEDEKPPQEDPPPDDPPEEDEEPPPKDPPGDPPTPSEQDCIERYAAIRRAKQRRDKAKADWEAAEARLDALSDVRDQALETVKEKAVEKGLEIIFEEIDVQSRHRRSRSDSGASEAGAGLYVKAFAKTIRWLARQGEKVLDPEIWSEAERYNRLGEEGRALVPDYEQKYALFEQRSNQWQTLVGQARKAGCEAHPSENPEND